MWDNEAERIGKQRCTPLGYALHGISDGLGFIALCLLLGIAVYLVHRGIDGTFNASLLWLFPIPFALAIVGWSLYRLSWVLARRKGFRYDYESREASWLEHGKRLSYRYNDSA